MSSSSKSWCVSTCLLAFYNYSQTVVQIAVSGTRLKDVRIGITLSWVYFLQVFFNKTYLEKS